jgi:hypothetical protein
MLTGVLHADIYIPNGKNTGYTFKSCAAFIINGSGVDFIYCGSDAGAVTCKCRLHSLLCREPHRNFHESVHGEHLQWCPRLQRWELLLPGCW